MFDKYFTKKIIKKIINDADLERVLSEDKSIGNGLFNSQCHNNALQKIYDNKTDYCDSILECVCISIDGGDVFVHYINQKNDGRFEDNTLGYRSKYYTYYITRRIGMDELEKKDIYQIFEEGKDMLYKKYFRISPKLFGWSL